MPLEGYIITFRVSAVSRKDRRVALENLKFDKNNNKENPLKGHLLKEEKRLLGMDI